MQPGDPRADPVVVDLIELAGQWVAVGAWPALGRTLRRLGAELESRFVGSTEFAARFRALERLTASSSIDGGGAIAEQIRRSYRQASVG
ncbi:MAG: hypothetical protein LC797_23645 [Chloroflexi bacterium]|nr:hypothetical protein [Chloroflexota bacterium]